MAVLLMGIVLVGVIWIFFTMRSKTYNAQGVIEPWFLQNDINPDTVRVCPYYEKGLARNADATVIVGSGKNIQGKWIGFVVEVVPNGVAESEILVPHGIATWHKNASIQAKKTGKPLMDVLVAMAANHRDRELK